MDKTRSELKHQVCAEPSTIHEASKAMRAGGEYLCCDCGVTFEGDAKTIKRHEKEHLPDDAFKDGGEYRQLEDIPNEELPDRWMTIPKMPWMHPRQEQARKGLVFRIVQESEDGLIWDELVDEFRSHFPRHRKTGALYPPEDEIERYLSQLMAAEEVVAVRGIFHPASGGVSEG